MVTDNFKPRATYRSFAKEIADNLNNPKLRSYQRARIDGERLGLKVGNECNWDRETMISHCMRPDSPSRWLGREVFETSFDDGSMRGFAEWYDRAATAAGYLACKS